MREGKPGVKFHNGDEEGWTPVVRRRTKRRLEEPTSQPSDDEDPKLTTYTRSVKFRMVDGVYRV